MIYALHEPGRVLGFKHIAGADHYIWETHGDVLQARLRDFTRHVHRNGRRRIEHAWPPVVSSIARSTKDL